MPGLALSDGARRGMVVAPLRSAVPTLRVNMRHEWLPEPEQGDEFEKLFASDTESWRGELHGEDESWRGDAHLADWPEHLAGPEYWMFKERAEER